VFNQKRSVIIIDENPIDIMILSKLIQTHYPDSLIQVFKSAKEALVFFRELKDWMKHSQHIVFLDLNMPIMDGWDFLQEYKKLSHEIQSMFRLYILSCSIYWEDILRAENESVVAGYLFKPLQKENLAKVMSQAGKLS
jgi:response regulator RpfG family c-di-GMP phosphodiesterase